MHKWLASYNINKVIYADYGIRHLPRLLKKQLKSKLIINNNVKRSFNTQKETNYPLRLNMQKVDNQISNKDGLLIPFPEYFKDFFAEVRNGNVPGHTLVTRSARNEDAPNGSWEILNSGGFNNWRLNAPQTFRIAAGGDANDAALGIGVQEIILELIDNKGARTVEFLTTNGNSPSSFTVGSHWRCMRMLASKVGVKYGTNIGTITLESGGQTIMRMLPGEGHARLGAISTGADQVGRLVGFVANVDSNRAVSVRFGVGSGYDTPGTPFNPSYLSNTYDALSSPFPLTSRAYAALLPEYCDLWFEGLADANNTAIGVDFAVLLIDNEYIINKPGGGGLVDIDRIL